MNSKRDDDEQNLHSNSRNSIVIRLAILSI